MNPTPLHLSPLGWNRLAAAFPQAHLLQTWEWGQSKLPNGWTPAFLGWQAAPAGLHMLPIRVDPGGSDDPPALQAAAMLLRRAIPIGGFAARLAVLYAPKGPLLRDWSDPALRRAVLRDLEAHARRSGAIFLKMDPDVRLGTGLPGTDADRPDPTGLDLRSELAAAGWLFSDEQVQFRNTVMLDLQPPEGALLARMAQKTRYNVRLAERRGVTVRPGTLDDLDLLYHMYAETATRDGFVIREEGYYHRLWSDFMQPGGPGSELPCAEPLIAEVEGEPVAAVVIFRFAGRAWYIYGMSRPAHREKMPNHLLQWQAMLRAKAAGCSNYDLWGAPDEFDESDPMWGVWRFKEGLGGEVVRHLGAWDYPASRLWYPLYTRLLPKLLEVMRRRARSKTQELTTKGRRAQSYTKEEQRKKEDQGDGKI